MTPSGPTPSWMREQMMAFPFLHRCFSLPVFFFHLSVYFWLSGDVRAFLAVATGVRFVGRQWGGGGHKVVCCFRRCSEPVITDGLHLPPSLSPSPVRSGGSATPAASHPKTGSCLSNKSVAADGGRPPKHSRFQGRKEGKRRMDG